MNKRAILAIIRKDLKVVSQNKMVLVPIFIVILIFFALFPWGVALIPGIIQTGGVEASDFLKIMAHLPASLQQELSGYNPTQQVVVYVLLYLLAPMFLLVPLLVASTFAADSFAGEKERKTMEALLYTPTTDRDLLVAKFISGWLAAIAVALAGFLLYSVMANAAAWSQMHRIFFPNTMWLVLIAWVVPALSGLGIAVMVLVSIRAQGFQEANQLGGVVVLPIVGLFYLQIAGVMYVSVPLMLILGLVIYILDGLLIWLGSRSFRRGRLLGA
jgi:ABC-2 type transport system permease protein